MNREQALELLHEWIKNPALVKHCLSVEKAMAAYALEGGFDEAQWGLAGLLHDFDYERYPEPPHHSREGARVLREMGVEDEVVGAILSHTPWNREEYPLDRPIRITLFAVDELCGLIYAAALVRPQRMEGMAAKSIRKKMKTPSFAAGVNREDIEAGAKLLGKDLNDHINLCIAAMSEHVVELGLTVDGSDQPPQG